MQIFSSLAVSRFRAATGPVLALSVAIAGLAAPAVAQSVEFMRNECSSVGQTYYRDFNAATVMQYNGQRVDGTHAINGTIYLETRSADFACSYESSGRRMIEFYADGRRQNAFLPGGGGNGGAPDGGDIVRVTGLSGNDVLNVRNGPGTSYRIIGALRNGDRVRRLRCETPGTTTWCKIEMMTDMRERGWVSARYLTGGAAQGGTATHLPSPPAQNETATHLPSPPLVAGAGQTTTTTVRFPAGSSGTEISEQIGPNASRRYIVNARAQQFLDFRLVAGGSGVSWRILNPDSTLLDQQPAARAYRGQLWQSGNHVIEVINASNRRQAYTAVFGIN